MGIASFKKNVCVFAQDPQITTTTIDDNDRSSEQRGEKNTNFVNKQFNASECSSIVYFYVFFYEEKKTE